MMNKEKDKTYVSGYDALLLLEIKLQVLLNAIRLFT